jgi:hypothetical protein
MTTRWLWILVVAVAPWTSDAASAKRDVVQISGFSVDFHLASKRQRKAVTASLEKQLDMVKDAGLPDDVVEFAQSVAIVIDPAMLSMTTNGQYMADSAPPHVRIKPARLPQDRAIVLHELMHAYRYQVLKGITPDIAAAYQRALSPGVYPAEYREAAFLRNTDEYFANMATTFLLGTSERQPYSCSIILAAQPKFVGYLTSLFGPHPCR